MRVLQTSLILILYLVMVYPAHGQNRIHQTWISLNFGQQEYSGDLGSETMQWKWGYDWVLGIDVTQYLGRSFNLDLSTTYGELDYLNLFNKSFISSNAIIQLKPFKTAVQPFIGTGIGVISYWGDNNRYNKSGISMQLPFQGGIDFRISKGTSFTMKATYNRTFTDEIDDFNFDSQNHDDFMVYTVGLKFRIKKANDNDGDGVKNRNDLCPNEYGETFWGCPDSDRDGIVDVEDECPTLAGRAFSNGCPDSDRDGISDLVDECPDVRANSMNSNGCPSEIEEDSISNVEPMPVVSRLTDQQLDQESTSISRNILFDNDSAALDTTSYRYLNRLSNLMLEDVDLRLIIRVHTNKAGNSNENLKLTVDQAEAIKHFLVTMGVVPERIFAFGYGGGNPFWNQEGSDGTGEQVNLVLYYPKQSENSSQQN